MNKKYSENFSSAHDLISQIVTMSAPASTQSTDKVPDQEVKSHHDLEDAHHLDMDEALVKKIMRKIDLHLMVPLWIIFALGFLDRINLGNVAVLGIIPELKLGGNGLNIALQVFFVPYILLDIPSNIVLRKIRPSTLISILAFLWGKLSLLLVVVLSIFFLILILFQDCLSTTADDCLQVSRVCVRASSRTRVV